MRLLFGIQLVVGLLMLLMGGVEYARPFALTDSFLSHEQLIDEQTHRAALDVMQRAQRHDPHYWLIGGAIITTTSMLGLRPKRIAPA
jgi:hypothetical protein